METTPKKSITSPEKPGNIRWKKNPELLAELYKLHFEEKKKPKEILDIMSKNHPDLYFNSYLIGAQLSKMRKIMKEESDASKDDSVVSHEASQDVIDPCIDGGPHNYQHAKGFSVIYCTKCGRTKKF